MLAVEEILPQHPATGCQSNIDVLANKLLSTILYKIVDNKNVE